MRPPKLSADDVNAILIELFRTHGYEGTSLSKLAEASGLVKASLYHRFPGGKEQMANATMDVCLKDFATAVLAPLQESGEPADRLRRTARNIRQYYDGGEQPCLLDTLSLGEIPDSVAERVASTLEAWIGALAAVAREVGHARGDARRRAEDAVAAIEGGLVISRVSGRTQAFDRALKRLPEAIIGDA
ncbi:MAG: TetR/AcrR family transcriptional regulator [Planctomycetota bacterium]